MIFLDARAQNTTTWLSPLSRARKQDEQRPRKALKMLSKFGILARQAVCMDESERRP
jgi:hypothetical protein